MASRKKLKKASRSKRSKSLRSRRQTGGALGKSTLTGKQIAGEYFYQYASAPVLSYYSIDGCPHCIAFDIEWDKLLSNRDIMEQLAIRREIIYGNNGSFTNSVITAGPSLVVYDKDTIEMAILSDEIEKTEENIIQWLTELNVLKQMDKAAKKIADHIVPHRT